MTLFFLFISYLLGSIPFGLILTRAAGLGDIRAIGSGNIGATNVLRTGNKALAAATLFLDGAKGALAVLIVQHFNRHWLLAGLAVFIGHLFPVWLGFRGGKGVATGLGVLLAACFPVGLISCAAWLAAVAILKISSAAALIAFALAPVVAVAFGRNGLALLAAFIAILVFWKHRANISRLRLGTEPRVGSRS